MIRLGVVLVTICLSTQVSAQKDFPKNEKGEIEISEVVSTNLTKDQMVSYFKKWIAVEFQQSQDAIQFEDAASGDLVAKLRIPAGQTSLNKKDITTDLTYTVVVECKDNKFRYTIKDVLTHARIFGGGAVPRFYNDTPYRHFKHIEEYQQKIAQIQSESGDETKAQEEISNCNAEIEREKTLFNSEYDALMQSIDQMKSYMTGKNDF
jgi:hypothetical protein